MRRSAKILMLLLCLLAPSMSVPAADPSIEKLLPSPACPEGWTLEDRITLYTKENLFDRINGEAELYFPYGFELLGSARYASSRNPLIAVEADVYKMGSLLDAFGMFANYRRADDMPAKVGLDGTISSTQILFYQDRYFVRVQSSGATNLDEGILLACARMVSQRLPQDSGRPRELDVFKLPVIVPGSERYIAQSLLGYSFFRRGMMADALLAGGTVQVIVVPGDSDEAARRAFDEYRAYLTASGVAMAITEFPGRMAVIAVDPLYGNIYVEQAGRYVFGAIRVRDTADAKPLVDQLRKRLVGSEG